jgi:hypothetical protein
MASIFFIENRENQDFDARLVGLDGPRHLDAVLPGEAEVEQDDVRLEVHRRGDGVVAVGRRADDLQPVVVAQELELSFEDRGLILDHQNTHWIGHGAPRGWANAAPS